MTSFQIAWSIYLISATVMLGALWFALGMILQAENRRLLWSISAVLSLFPWYSAGNIEGPLAPAVFNIFFGVVGGEMPKVYHSAIPLVSTLLAIVIGSMLYSVLIRALKK